MKTDEEIIKEAKEVALNVPFLKTTEELSTYAGAIYSATKWGINVDGKNEAILERYKSGKYENSNTRK